MASQEMQDAARALRERGLFSGEIDVAAMRRDYETSMGLLEMPPGATRSDFDADGVGASHIAAPDVRQDRGLLYFHGGGYDTYEITGVDGHDLLKFHWGNWETDSTGCILLGRRFGEPQGKPGIFESRVGFEEFMRRTGGRPSFELEVRAAA